jgi:phosphoribosylglycinamide formyltransferase-1
VSPAIAAPLKLLALISGHGSNLQALIDAIGAGEINAVLVGVVSNRADSPGLQRARAAGIPTTVVDQSKFETRDDFNHELLRVVCGYDPRLVALAGFMRILDDDFVDRFDGCILNVHPSLLPKYAGLNTYRRVLDSGDRHHGCSIHFVNRDLDGGPVVAQSVVPVQAGDTEKTLSARVQAAEHKLYPLVVGWFASGRLRCTGGMVTLDGKTLNEPAQPEMDELFCSD